MADSLIGYVNYGSHIPDPAACRWHLYRVPADAKKDDPGTLAIWTDDWGYAQLLLESLNERGRMERRYRLEENKEWQETAPPAPGASKNTTSPDGTSNPLPLFSMESR